MSRTATGRVRADTGAAGLALAALGVVFGDIGTSPLYAIQAVFAADGGAVGAARGDVYGVISLVFWSITIIVSVKYVGFIMRADNDGEGGIMALTALLQRARCAGPMATSVLVTLGVLGAALFYGDGMITPAISVLSAVEGLKVAAPGLGSLVLPITLTVLTVLFAIQRYGTTLVGRLFGPVMAVWFGALALVGIVEIAQRPGSLQALSPTYGAQFILDRSGVAFIALGSVVLAVTGAEALYADMGHFGRGPIRRAWFLLVFPALTLNYVAQGSLIVRSPADARNPFFLLLPGWAQMPMVVLATLATVIASQAVISGAFSVTRQAVALGFLPQVVVRHTSRSAIGQVYVPAVNLVLFVVVVGIVVAFGSATALASAYGVAVTGTFILNTILFLAVARLLWHRPRWMIALGGAVFLTVEVTFFAANLTKVAHGGWLPLSIALVAFVMLTTWRRGSDILAVRRAAQEGPIDAFIDSIDADGSRIGRVPGTAVFLHANPLTAPLALRAIAENNHVLHERVIILTVETARVPHVSDADRLVAGDVGRSASGITAMTARYGFQDQPDVPAALRLVVRRRMVAGHIDAKQVSYFLSDVSIQPGDLRGLNGLRARLFVAMRRNAVSRARNFRLPGHRTITVGAQMDV